MFLNRIEKLLFAEEALACQLSLSLGIHDTLSDVSAIKCTKSLG